METAASRSKSNFDETTERHMRTIIKESVEKQLKQKQEKSDDMSAHNEARILKLVSNMKTDVCSPLPLYHFLSSRSGSPRSFWSLLIPQFRLN